MTFGFMHLNTVNDKDYTVIKINVAWLSRVGKGKTVSTTPFEQCTKNMTGNGVHFEIQIASWVIETERKNTSQDSNKSTSNQGKGKLMEVTKNLLIWTI